MSNDAPQPSELEADARTALIATAEAAATHLKRALAAEAQIAKLQADGDRLAEAAQRGESYLGQLGFDHNHSVRLQIRQALIEWKDRA